MNDKTFIHLYSLTMDPADLTNVAYAAAESTWLCHGCSRPKPSMRAIDASLVREPIDQPLNIAARGGLALAFKPFLEKFPSRVIERDLYLGRVFGPNGQVLDDWVTFRGRRRLIVRGSEKAGIRKCEQCSRDCYFAMGDRYLYPNPPPDATVFESDLFGLVLSSALYSTLQLETWPMLDVDTLPVLDEPRDGLGKLLNP